MAMRLLALPLWERGWRHLVPVSPSLKRAYEEGWPTLAEDTSHKRACHLICAHANSSVGFVSGLSDGLVVVDCDDTVHNEALAAITLNNLGPTLFKRIGNPKKFAWLYRTEEPARTVAIDDPAFNIRGPGQQIVGYGRHPLSPTGFYHWPEAQPLTAGPEELPTVTQDQLDDTMREIGKRWPNTSVTDILRGTSFARRMIEPVRASGMLKTEAAAAVLGNAKPGGRFDTMRNCVGYLAHYGYSDDEIRSALAQTWEDVTGGGREQQLEDRIDWFTAQHVSNDDLIARNPVYRQLVEAR